MAEPVFQDEPVTPDITIIQKRDEPLTDQSTDEVLHMILGNEEDVDIGRMSESAGGDPSDYDFLPRDIEEMTEEQAQYAYGGGQGDQNSWQTSGSAGDGITQTLDSSTAPTTVTGDLDVFDEPEAEVFPVYKAALRQFQATSKVRPVRVDGEKAYHHFVADKVVNEMGRHVHNMQHGHDVLGAAESIANLSAASDHHEAIDAMPQVPLDLPSFAKGKVRCWKDGDHVLCSMFFTDAAGQPRVATTAAKPLVDDESIVEHAAASGIDPVVVLGALPDLADVACGKRLVKQLSRTALAAHEHPEVLGMEEDETVVLPQDTNAGENAPLAALMYVQQRADSGDPQAMQEMALIQAASESPSGQRIAKPMLDESARRLAEGRKQKQDALNPSLWTRIKRFLLTAGA